MFKEIIGETKIAPNFLNSILTNAALYDMFKNDFDANAEYFQGIDREEYLGEMLKFIEDALFSSNVFHIYGEPEDLETGTEGKLAYIKRFYDDFLLEVFRESPEKILKTKIFKGFEFAYKNDLYAKRTTEFLELYEYVFKTSLDYEGIVRVLIKEPLANILAGETLSILDFDILCNYVKNNIYGFIDMDLVTALLHNHAYKSNHIFDREVTEIIVSSTIRSYLEEYDIPVAVEFHNGLDSKKESDHSFEPNTIHLDYSLIDGFISLNYVELFENAFKEAELIKIHALLTENRCDYDTLKVLMNLLVEKVDLERLFDDAEYNPQEFYADLKASNFVKTLRFFSMFGVNLHNGYIASKTASIEVTEVQEIQSKKEVSLDQKFDQVFSKHPNRRELIKKFAILKLLFNQDGSKKKTIELMKQSKNTEYRDTIIDYLHSRIIDPETMIEDVNDLSNYRPKDEEVKELVTQELKYIYVDTFFYSLDSYLKLYKSRLDVEEFLDDLLLKINCIKDTPLTHRFIDEAVFTITDMKQND